MTERVLYQFPISHFAEKVRWLLDAKRLSYRINDVIPGLHVPILKRLTGGRTVPALRDGTVVLGDSTAIAIHLEDTYERPFLPTDPAGRSQVLELVRSFDASAGPGVRDFIYWYLLMHRGVARRRILRGYPWWVRALGAVVTPAFERGLRRTYRLRPGSAETARALVLAAADQIEALTDGRPERHLVRDSLSLADITAASLLGPLIGPDESPWSPHDDDPDEVRTLRKNLLDRPAGAWVVERYRVDRRPETNL